MSRNAWKRNVSFVLVEPVESGNIGAAARAMKNMGFTDLALVNPPDPIGPEASWFAHNAMDVLREALIFKSIEAAVADKAIIVATSRRKGKNRGNPLSPEEASLKLAEAAQHNSVALLFGREQRGLFTEELEHANYLVTIPTDSDQPSLNLGQAVMVMAYELGKVKLGPQPEGTEPRMAPHNQVEQLYERFMNILNLLGYTKAGDRDLGKQIVLTSRHLLGRSELREKELKMLYGVVTRIEQQLLGNFNRPDPTKK